MTTTARLIAADTALRLAAFAEEHAREMERAREEGADEMRELHARLTAAALAFRARARAAIRRAEQDRAAALAAP